MGKMHRYVTLKQVICIGISGLNSIKSKITLIKHFKNFVNKTPTQLGISITVANSGSPAIDQIPAELI
jgi:hypothetical protein